MLKREETTETYKVRLEEEPVEQSNYMKGGNETRRTPGKAKSARWIPRRLPPKVKTKKEKTKSVWFRCPPHNMLHGLGLDFMNSSFLNSARTYVEELSGKQHKQLAREQKAVKLEENTKQRKMQRIKLAKKTRKGQPVGAFNLLSYLKQTKYNADYCAFCPKVMKNVIEQMLAKLQQT